VTNKIKKSEKDRQNKKGRIVFWVFKWTKVRLGTFVELILTLTLFGKNFWNTDDLLFSRWSIKFAQFLSDWITTTLMQFSHFSLSCFEGELSNSIASLLSLDHDLESIKISGGCSSAVSSKLSSMGCGLPFGCEVELLNSLLQSSSSSSSQNWDSEFGEVQSLEWKNDSWEVNSIDLNSISINNINNNDHLAMISTIVDVCDSTCFNDISNALKQWNAINIFVWKCVLTIWKIYIK